MGVPHANSFSILLDHSATEPNPKYCSKLCFSSSVWFCPSTIATIASRTSLCPACMCLWECTCEGGYLCCKCDSIQCVSVCVVCVVHIHTQIRVRVWLWVCMVRPYSWERGRKCMCMCIAACWRRWAVGGAMEEFRCRRKWAAVYACVVLVCVSVHVCIYTIHKFVCTSFRYDRHTTHAEKTLTHTPTVHHTPWQCP